MYYDTKRTAIDILSEIIADGHEDPSTVIPYYLNPIRATIEQHESYATATHELAAIRIEIEDLAASIDPSDSIANLWQQRIDSPDPQTRATAAALIAYHLKSIQDEARTCVNCETPCSESLCDTCATGFKLRETLLSCVAFAVSNAAPLPIDSLLLLNHAVNDDNWDVSILPQFPHRADCDVQRMEA